MKVTGNMNQITVTGVVLAATPVGEYDKRIVILTKERGKIAAFARGARKPNSALVGVTSPFSFGQFHLYEGRTSYTLMSASIFNYFAELRADVEGAYYGFYFLELADYYARAENNETELLKLLYQTFRALLSPSLQNRLVRYIYEIKIVCINGEAPQVFQCVACGDKDVANATGRQENVADTSGGQKDVTDATGRKKNVTVSTGRCKSKPRMFSARRGGLVCSKCVENISDAMMLDTSTLYTLQYIVSSPIEKLYTFRLSDKVLKELETVVSGYLDVYIDKKFKSLEILEQIIT